jgi:hypothetical protein
MDTMLEAAEVFPAGEYLRDELDERGWTVTARRRSLPILRSLLVMRSERARNCG